VYIVEIDRVHATHRVPRSHRSGRHPPPALTCSDRSQGVWGSAHTATLSCVLNPLKTNLARRWWPYHSAPHWPRAPNRFWGHLQCAPQCRPGKKCFAHPRGWWTGVASLPRRHLQGTGITQGTVPAKCFQTHSKFRHTDGPLINLFEFRCPNEIIYHDSDESLMSTPRNLSAPPPSPSPRSRFCSAAVRVVVVCRARFIHF
jgi:hypothetical protein